MITLKGAEVSAKIKDQVQEIVEKLDGHVPTAAIVRVGERPDDLSYEKGVIKKIASFGMEAKTYAFPEDISEEAFLEEFRKINADESVDGILLFMPLPKHMNGKLFESAIDPVKDLDGISPVNRAKVFAGEADGFAPCCEYSGNKKTAQKSVPFCFCFYLMLFYAHKQQWFIRYSYFFTVFCQFLDYACFYCVIASQRSAFFQKTAAVQLVLKVVVHFHTYHIAFGQLCHIFLAGQRFRAIHHQRHTHLAQQCFPLNTHIAAACHISIVCAHFS
ncbi:MAG: hypothetical protein II263_00690, partial [Lachnospiraceae bacterium]|nr:hypothetical protein [Lachnospiraceae bacterium]